VLPARFSNRPCRALATLVTTGAALTLLAGTAPLAGAASHGSTHVVRAAVPPGHINHILVIELENEGFDTTFGSSSPATYLNGTLRHKGELLQNYYAIGHVSLDNYIAQVSGQAPNQDTSADCLPNGATFGDVTPGTPDPDQAANPGQVDGQGCVYPASVKTIASQLDAKYPPNHKTHVAAWRAYEQDMGNTPSRDGGTPDPTGGTDCAHPAISAVNNTNSATAADQYAARHNPMIWFHSTIDNVSACNANVVPLGTLTSSGTPSPSGHLAKDLKSESTTPRFGFITPNLCNDGHDDTCAGPNSTGGNVGGLVAADQFLKAWMPTILGSPAYKHGDMLVVITFDEAELGGSNANAACCAQQPGPNATTNGGGQIGALLLEPKYIAPGSVDTAGSYNHYSALRSYEDLLGLTTGGADGEGHLGFAAAKGLTPFGTDVFNRLSGASR
jgi:hypothetical protein